MIRFVLLVSAFGAVAGQLGAGGPSCDLAVPICPVGNAGECSGADAIFTGTGVFSESEDNGLGDGQWYSITVAGGCEKITIGSDTCTGTPGFGTTITAYQDCVNGQPQNFIAEDTDTCINDVDALLSFDDTFKTQKTYYILVTVDDPADSDKRYGIIGEIEFKGPGSCGDPHFYRWGHPARDSFHGECDMVLLHQENVADGMNLDIHIRTTIRDNYSFIEAAAVKIGPDAIEFQMGSVFVNGEKVSTDQFPLSVGVGNTITKDEASAKPIYNVMVQDKISIEVRGNKQFMSVKLNGKSVHYDGSVGILGDAKTGDMVARDGSVFAEGDFEQFAFEWQVHPSDPQIFMEAREPQLPYERCRMPSVSAESRRRKLRGQDRKLYEQALVACAENHIPENVESCVDDVMFTGDIDLAEAF